MLSRLQISGNPSAGGVRPNRLSETTAGIPVASMAQAVCARVIIRAAPSVAVGRRGDLQGARSVMVIITMVERPAWSGAEWMTQI